MDKCGKSLEEGIQALWKSHGFNEGVSEEFRVEKGYGVWVIKAILPEMKRDGKKQIKTIIFRGKEDDNNVNRN